MCAITTGERMVCSKHWPGYGRFTGCYFANPCNDMGLQSSAALMNDLTRLSRCTKICKTSNYARIAGRLGEPW